MKLDGHTMKYKYGNTEDNGKPKRQTIKKLELVMYNNKMHI